MTKKGEDLWIDPQPRRGQSPGLREHQARVALHHLLKSARPGELVTTVDNLSRLSGATADDVAVVLGEAVDADLLSSPLRRKGVYRRTDKALPDDASGGLGSDTLIGGQGRGMVGRLNKTNMARNALYRMLSQAEPDEYVTSVADLSRNAAGLSTGATVKVLREAVDAGWLRSVRGPDGGYWRTSVALPTGPTYGSDQQLLMESLEQTQMQLESVRTTVAQALGHAGSLVQDGPAVVSTAPLTWPVRDGDEAWSMWSSPDNQEELDQPQNGVTGGAGRWAGWVVQTASARDIIAEVLARVAMLGGSPDVQIPTGHQPDGVAGVFTRTAAAAANGDEIAAGFLKEADEILSGRTTNG